MITRQQFIVLQIIAWILVVSIAWLAARPADSGRPVGGVDHVFIPPGTFTLGCVAGDTLCWEEELPRREYVSNLNAIRNCT